MTLTFPATDSYGAKDIAIHAITNAIESNRLGKGDRTKPRVRVRFVDHVITPDGPRTVYRVWARKGVEEARVISGFGYTPATVEMEGDASRYLPDSDSYARLMEMGVIK